MQVIIHRKSDAEISGFQVLDTEWYGQKLIPPFLFRFEQSDEGLIFRARRAAAASVHPQAGCGQFHEDLWKYDTAEFFFAAADGSKYLEFNLNPVGAWWCRVFSAPRVPHADFADFCPSVRAGGINACRSWECEACLPNEALAALGIDLNDCRLAATAILGSPEQLFLTTATDISGEPDFHRPQAWEMASVSEGG